MQRRRFLGRAVAMAAVPVAGSAVAQMKPGGAACAGDGTPAQFLPRNAPDPSPQDNDIAKFPRCPYCGMDRKEHHRTRMLVQYSDDLTDGTCSIHCLSLSLGVNIDREPKNIWGPDYGSATEPRPLTPVDNMVYLIGADLKHAMTKRSKHSFASLSTAKEFQAKHGGTLGNFNDALRESYLDMASDVTMIRKNREERRKRAAEMKKG